MPDSSAPPADPPVHTYLTGYNAGAVIHDSGRVGGGLSGARRRIHELKCNPEPAR